VLEYVVSGLSALRLDRRPHRLGPAVVFAYRAVNAAVREPS